MPIFTLLAIVMTFVGINRPIVSPFPFGIKAEQMYAYVSSPEFSVIIDSDQDRALFLNSRGQLVNIVNKSIFSSREYFFDSTPLIHGDSVWLVGCTYKPGDIFVSKENLVRYSSKGKLLGKSMEFTYDFSNPEEYTNSARIKYVEIDGSHGLAYTSISGNGKILEFDPYASSPCAIKEVGTWDASEYSDKLPEIDFLYVPFSPLFGLLNTLFWISILYLSVLVIFSIFKYLRSLVREKNMAALKKIYIGVIIVTVATVLVLFYSHALNKLYLESEVRILSNMASQLRTRLSEPAYKLISDYSEGRPLDRETYIKARDILNKSSIIARQEGVSYTPMIYTKNKDSELICIACFKDELAYGQDTYSSAEDLHKGAILDTPYYVVNIFNVPWGRFLCAVARYEGLDGGILVFNDYLSLENANNTRNLMLLMALIAVAGVFIFIITESRAFYKSLVRHRKGKEEI